MRSRKKSILYGAPLFMLSFLLPWFPWMDYNHAPAWVVGAHLIVALFFYDGFFSFVLLAWCSVFSEATTDHVSRVRAIKYMQIIHLVSHNVIFVMEKVSGMNSYRNSSEWELLICFRQFARFRSIPAGYSLPCRHRLCVFVVYGDFCVG